MVSYDLRHSVAAFAAGRGLSSYLIGKLFCHKTARTTEIYVHLADDARESRGVPRRAAPSPDRRGTKIASDRVTRSVA
jgi:hypothetical protein